MTVTAHGRTLPTDDFAPHRIRSAISIALAASVPAAAAAVLVTGSGVTGVLTGAFTIACVALAALVI